MRLEKISSYEKLIELEDEWNCLLNKSETNTVFLSHEWIKNWWKFFGTNNDLFILVVRNHNNLVGIAPLMITYQSMLGVKTRKIKFIGTPLSDYSDFIAGKDKDKVLETIFEYLLENKNLWDSIILEEIPENSSTFNLSKGILKDSIYHEIFFTNESLSLNLNDIEEQDLHKITNKRDLRRHIKKLNESGKLTFSTINNKNDAMKYLEVLYQQHIINMDRKSIPSMYKDEKCKQFFNSLTKELLSKNMIGLYVLEFNGEPIAVQFGFNYNNKYLDYSRSYDLKYYNNGPGLILNKYFIEKYAKDGYDEVDFLRGSEDYKFRFSNKKIRNLGLAIHKNMTGHIVNKYYNKTKEKIMKNQEVHQFISKYINKISNNGLAS